MKTTTLAIACSSLLAIVPAALAADKSEIGGSFAPKDAAFVMKAAQGGLLEVQAGQLAQQKASDASAKEMGKMLVDDHGKANEELKGLVAKKGGQVPTTLDSQHQAMLDKVSKQEGAAFDKAYFDLLQVAHKKDIAEFEDASQNAKDPELKAFATKTLPVLRKHLEHVTKHDGSAQKSGTTR